MHVHFITVEIGIVRGCDTQVETKRLKVKHFDPMTNHRHLVEGRLTVENHIVFVL